MKVELIEREGVKYLSFKPEGMLMQTTIPVIQKGSRDEANAWTWNGSLDKPTVRPSVRTQYTDSEGNHVVIHYWLNDGVCKCLGDCTDGNANKDVQLSEIDNF